MVFNEVQTDMENEGYEVQSLILPACGVNAPHQRNRIWFIAHANSNGHELRGFKQNRFTKKEGISQQEQWQWIWANIRGISEQGITPNSNKERLQYGDEINSRKIPDFKEWLQNNRKINGLECYAKWDNFPTQSPICRRNDGLPNRMDRIKGLGNAIVPQVAFEIFKVIELAERQKEF